MRLTGQPRSEATAPASRAPKTGRGGLWLSAAAAVLVHALAGALLAQHRIQAPTVIPPAPVRVTLVPAGLHTASAAANAAIKGEAVPSRRTRPPTRSASTSGIQPRKNKVIRAAQPTRRLPPRASEAANRPAAPPPSQRAAAEAMQAGTDAAAEAPSALAISAPAPVAAASQPTAAAAPAEPYTAPHADAAYLRNPVPAYPHLARKLGWQGTVLLHVQVSADGRCAAVQLKRSSGHAVLDEAALQAVKTWRFIPARQGDRPVNAWVDVPIRFNLKPE